MKDDLSSRQSFDTASDRMTYRKEQSSKEAQNELHLAKKST